MAKRIVKYGLKDEVLERAKKMCGKNFEDWECPEFEEVKKILSTYEKGLEALRKIIGENRKSPVKLGELVPIYEGAEELSPVFKIYRDILNNEIWVTKWTYETHIGQGLTPEAQRLIRSRIPIILKNPHWILYDKLRGGGIVYAREFTKAIPPNRRIYFCAVGHQSLKLYTAKNKQEFFQQVGERYILIYGSVKG